MSRVNQGTGNGSRFPDNPITKYQGRNANTGYVVGKGDKAGHITARIGIDNDVITKTIEPVTLTKAGNLPAAAKGKTLTVVESVFKKSRYNDHSGHRARSTEYRNKKDRIAIFGPHGHLCSVQAGNAPRFNDDDEIVDDGGKPMSSTQHLYLYSDELDVCFLLELNGATGRDAFFQFRNAYKNARKEDGSPLYPILDKDGKPVVDKEGNPLKIGNNYPSFVWGGTRAFTDDEIAEREQLRENWGDRPFKPAKLKASYRTPVFHPVEPTADVNARANYYAEQLDQYFNAHPDFYSPGDEAKDEKSAESVQDAAQRAATEAAADKVLKDKLDGLPTATGSEPEATDDLPF